MMYKNDFYGKKYKSCLKSSQIISLRPPKSTQFLLFFSIRRLSRKANSLMASLVKPRVTWYLIWKRWHVRRSWKLIMWYNKDLKTWTRCGQDFPYPKEIFLAHKKCGTLCYYSVFLSKLATFCINSVSFLFLLLIDVHVLHLNYIIISLEAVMR